MGRAAQLVPSIFDLQYNFSATTPSPPPAVGEGCAD